MDYLPGQYGMHYERIGLNDYHYDSLGLTGHRPYYAFAGNQLATGEQGSNGNYYWMQQQHSGQHLVGQKQYELTNHLGNVQVTVSDLPYKHGNDTIARISPALKAVYDYYPFGSPMPGRTIMDTARKCVDMTRLDRVWKAWEMTQAEIYTLSLINYHLDGEGKVFIDDNGAVEVEIADEYAVFYMDLQDSLNNGGEMVLHIDWLKEFSEKGFLLTLQGMDATGEMRVFYQKHYEKPEDAVYLNIADSFTNVSVGIQGNLHFGISNIRYFGGSWVNEEVLVRVCDDGGDRYRFGFNGMLKDNEWAGMGTHLDFGARIYDSRSGRWLSVDPLAGKYPSISPFAYVANNPMMFIDPDGREIKIAGDEKFKNITLTHMQMLTNDLLDIDDNGKVFIKEYNTMNLDKDLKYGTNLVSDLITNEFENVIQKSEDNLNRTYYSEVNTKYKKQRGWIAYSPESKQMKKDNSGIVGIDSEGSSFRSAFIGLAHELIHLKHMNQGKVFKFKNNSEIIEFKYSLRGPGAPFEKLDANEVETRKMEDFIRLEQKINLRINANDRKSIPDIEKINQEDN